MFGKVSHPAVTSAIDCLVTRVTRRIDLAGKDLLKVAHVGRLLDPTSLDGGMGWSNGQSIGISTDQCIQTKRVNMTCDGTRRWLNNMKVDKETCNEFISTV